jgi:Protein of unknown function (DUF3435)
MTCTNKNIQILRKLANKHGLSKQGKTKSPMYVDDLKKVLWMNLTTNEQQYPLGRVRMQVQLFLQLAGFTANRPAALLQLCYRHIKVSLVRDPEGGPHCIVIEISPEFCKGHLGLKQT